ncbi:MAG: UDP-glucose 4-epimerase [Sediminicola sp.]|jgi:UDP-glucose 4-epimerase
MKTYLVTGAAGFIGAAVAKALLQIGHQVVTVDNLSTGFKSHIPKGVEFIKGDCQNPKVIDMLHSYSFEAIYHIAGQSSGEVSFENPIYDLQTNGQSALQLLDLARAIGCKKFIYASTMSVYGDTENLPVEEGLIPNPKSFYGVGKLASEHYLKIYNKEFGIATAALRLFNVYGPGQNLTNMKQGMVSIFLAQALQNKHIHVKGSAERFRDFIYIDDVVKAFLRTETVLEKSQHQLFNVCSGVKTTVGELVEAITKQFDTKISTKFEGSTPGDQFGIYGNPEKMHDIIDCWDKVKFEDGIKSFFESLK